jgi:hypothetical protein
MQVETVMDIDANLCIEMAKDAKFLRREDVKRNEIVINLARDLFYKFLGQENTSEFFYIFTKNTCIAFIRLHTPPHPVCAFVYTTNPSMLQLISKNGMPSHCSLFK